ncbi:MAG: regulatory protein RecX [Lachnospiraceae bacterium]|nr:regulatory protein RecX [Lachnospiraceae bacterium]
MVVTGITEITKSRSRIEIDYAFAFVLYKGELRIYGMEEGSEISEETYSEITQKVLPKRAKLRAMNLLKQRSYTRHALAEKLKQGGYPEQVIKEALDYVESFHYIDDKQYASDYIEYNKEQKSQRKIFQDLMQKGVPENLIQEAWEEHAGDASRELEREQILFWAKKKNFSAETADFKAKQKMMAFLYRKGFKVEDIRSVLLLDITPN